MNLDDIFTLSKTLQEPLQYPFFQRALLGCVLLGFASGYLSAYVVLRRLALAADALSHALLPGVAVAALWFGLAPLGLFMGGLTAAILVALGGFLVSRSSRLSDETGIAAFFVIAFAGGFLLVHYAGQHGLVRVDLTHFLFGNLLGMSDPDLWLVYGVSAGTSLLLTALHRPLLLLLFEPAIARSLGIAVTFLHCVLLGLMVCVMVASLQAVGVVLSLGMLILPGATAYLWSDSFDHIPWSAAGFGVLGSTLGLWISYLVDQPSGPCLVLVLGSIFLLSYLFSPKYGVIAHLRRPRHLHGESLARWKNHPTEHKSPTEVPKEPTSPDRK